MAPRERKHYIDIAKGLLILFLPIHHFSTATIKLDLSSPYEWIVTSWQFPIVLFFMAAFFFFSGYCSNFNKASKDFYISLIKQIAIPYIVFTIIGAIFIFIKKGEFDNWLVNPPYTTLWFLNALFFSKAVLYQLLKHIKSQTMTIIFSFLTLVAGVLLNHYKIGINVLAFWHSLIALFFVTIGFFYKKHLNQISKYEYLSLPLYIFFLFLYRYYFSYINFTAGIYIRPKQIPLFIILSLLGTISLLYLSKKTQRNAYLEYFGRNSLIVYCIHFIILYEIADIVYSYISPSSCISFMISLILIYTPTYLFCYLFCLLFKRKPFCFAIGKTSHS